MIKIRPRGNETVQQLLKRFRRILEKEGIIREMKKKAFYEKPSEIRSRTKRRIKREQEKRTREDAEGN